MSWFLGFRGLRDSRARLVGVHRGKSQLTWTGRLLALTVTLGSVVGCATGSTGQPVAISSGDDPAAYAPYTYDPVEPAPPLDLIDQTGARFSLTQLRGKTALVSFGYSHCPDVCPTTLAIDRDVLLQRGSDAAVVFVTIDPARDTSAALTEYLKYFGAPMIGLTGSDAAIAATAAAWHVGYEKGEVSANGSYSMTHTAGTFVVDPAGNLRFLYPYATPANVLVGAIDGLTR
ncbi:MAG TPA: SCO family protein [Vicinamibacteria bacterium]|nr:SCO family protein [Vicinamibacteria bacterium]